VPFGVGVGVDVRVIVCKLGLHREGVFMRDKLGITGVRWALSRSLGATVPHLGQARGMITKRAKYVRSCKKVCS
jgi:hypothetical protein